MNIDFLAFAAHPDDAELSMGGTIAKLTGAGRSFGIIDLTEGEQGTRGNTHTRYKESEDASKILGLNIRENLKLRDGNIFVDEGNTQKVISIIRKYRPKIIFAPYINDRHPDHIETSRLIKRAFFQAGLPKIPTEYEGTIQEAYRPAKIFYFAQTYEFHPTFIVDISDSFNIKMKAIKAYKTQFHVEGFNIEEPETFISTPEFIQYIEARAKTYGFKIGKKYGEPFYSEELIELDLINYMGKI